MHSGSKTYACYGPVSRPSLLQSPDSIRPAILHLINLISPGLPKRCLLYTRELPPLPPINAVTGELGNAHHPHIGPQYLLLAASPKWGCWRLNLPPVKLPTPTNSKYAQTSRNKGHRTLRLDRTHRLLRRVLSQLHPLPGFVCLIQ
jgi:hypothetical protein